MFLQASVILSKGGSTSVHAGISPRAGSSLRADIPLPQEQVPPAPRAGTPQEQAPPKSRHPPPAQSMLGDTVNARVVRILLECKLVYFCQ